MEVLRLTAPVAGAGTLTGAVAARWRNGGDVGADDVVDIDLASARRGDPDAFGRLVRRHGGLLEAACRSAGAGPQDRDDALQAAVIAIWRGLDGFRGEAALSTWLYRVARNAALRSLRRSGPPSDPVGDLPERGRVTEFDGTVATHQVVVEALRSLPDDQREALLLSAYASMTSAEIARTLGVAEGTVRSWVSRARAVLRRHLEEVEV